MCPEVERQGCDVIHHRDDRAGILDTKVECLDISPAQLTGVYSDAPASIRVVRNEFSAVVLTTGGTCGPRPVPPRRASATNQVARRTGHELTRLLRNRRGLGQPTADRASAPTPFGATRHIHLSCSNLDERSRCDAEPKGPPTVYEGRVVQPRLESIPEGQRRGQLCTMLGQRSGQPGCSSSDRVDRMVHLDLELADTSLQVQQGPATG